MSGTTELTMTILSMKPPSFNNAYLFSLLTLLIWVVRRVLSGRGRRLGKPLPSPGGLPWAGPVWAVDAAGIYKTFKEWADQHGPLYEVTLFGQNLIIVSDPNIAKEIMAQRGKTVSDRPSIALVDNSKTSGKYLPFLGNNNVLTRQRRFGVLINTYTARQKYHGRFQPEVVHFLHQLLHKRDEPFLLLEQLCQRLSSRMAYGVTSDGAAISRSAHNLMKNLSPGGRITNTLTFLRYIPGFMHSEHQNEARRIKIEERVWKGAFYAAKSAYERGTLLNSYTKYYFDNLKQCELDEGEAINGIGMMATVSILTIVAPMQKWLIAMSENPKWQTIVQEELEEVLGDRLADLDDMPDLPKLRAVIVESVRWASPIPTGIPHRLEADMEYNGYHLGKNSNVLACDWAISRSNDQYTDAHIFDPCRYLEPTSPHFKSPLSEYPKLQGQTAFGYGRRACIGQEYVAAQMFVTCAAILYAFNISKGVNPKTGREVEIDVMNGTPHVIPIMEPVDLRFTVRDEWKAKKIQAMLETLKMEE